MFERTNTVSNRSARPPTIPYFITVRDEGRRRDAPDPPMCGEADCERAARVPRYRGYDLHKLDPASMRKPGDDLGVGS